MELDWPGAYILERTSSGRVSLTLEEERQVSFGISCIKRKLTSLTGRDQPCLRRLQCRISLLRRSLRRGRTWNTASSQVSKLFECSIRSSDSLPSEVMLSGSWGLEDERKQWRYVEPCLRVV